MHDNHYRKMKIEPIDVIEQILSITIGVLENKQRYCVGQAIKYLMRCGAKGSYKEDLEKAMNYLHRALYGTWWQPEVKATDEPWQEEKS